MDYAMPRADDMPAFAVGHHNVPSTSNPLGVKGAGEAGCVGAPPAIINAILDALRPCGVKWIEMPATPHQVWRAIRAARAGGGGTQGSASGCGSPGAQRQDEPTALGRRMAGSRDSRLHVPPKEAPRRTAHTIGSRAMPSRNAVLSHPPIYSLEDLGLVPRGEAGRHIPECNAPPGARLPLNTSRVRKKPDYAGGIGNPPKTWMAGPSPAMA
jgi:hypothetical protein